MSKHIKKNTQHKGRYIKNNTDVIVEDFDKNGNDKNVFISIKNIQYNFQCFSDWQKAEMSKFWKFNINLHKMTWQQVYSTARKDDKTGLAYTVIPRGKYPKSQFMDNLDKGINMFELRVDGEMRVHGFRLKSVFYLCFLDREHAICK